MDLGQGVQELERLNTELEQTEEEIMALRYIDSLSTKLEQKEEEEEIVLSKITHEDFLCLFVCLSSVTLRGLPLDSETGWTGELWLNTVLLILEN